MKDDDMRTRIQSYLEEYCNVDQRKSEDYAEGLYDYLLDAGYHIVDDVDYSIISKAD